VEAFGCRFKPTQRIDLWMRAVGVPTARQDGDDSY